MSNDFVALPAPSHDGAGAWVDCSSLGGLRTIVVETDGAFVTIECCNQASAADAYPIAAFQKTGEQSVQVAAHWMRAVTSNFGSGTAPVVNAGSTGDGTTTDQLTVTAGAGTGTAADTSALPSFKTVQVTPGFTGSVNIEISEDAGATWATAFSFQPGGARSESSLFLASRMRVQRVNVTGGVTPQVWVGATAPPGGGGGGGGGGGAPFLTISSFEPNDGDAVNAVAGAVNVIDCQNVAYNITVVLPAANGSPAGTPLELVFVNLSSAADGLRAQFVGASQQPIAIALLQVATTGSDKLNGITGGATAAFAKLSDGARFISDGASNWYATSASWYNETATGVTPAAGNVQINFPTSAVPSIIGVSGLAGNTTAVQALSAGYAGQQVIIVNKDPSHTFKLQPGFGGSLTGNCQPFIGLAAGYTLAVGSSRLVVYSPDLDDATLGRWYVLGDG